MMLKTLLLVGLVAAASGGRSAASARSGRTAKMTRRWRAQDGVGSFNSLRTAGGSSLTRLQSPSCTEAGFFPMPGSCTDFYRCVDWTGTGLRFSVFRFNCPAGTVFDDDLDICNHPWAVTNPPQCAGQTTTPTGGTGAAATGSTGSGSTGTGSTGTGSTGTGSTGTGSTGTGSTGTGSTGTGSTGTGSTGTGSTGIGSTSTGSTGTGSTGTGSTGTGSTGTGSTGTGSTGTGSTGTGSTGTGSTGTGSIDSGSVDSGSSGPVDAETTMMPETDETEVTTLMPEIPAETDNPSEVPEAPAANSTARPPPFTLVCHHDNTYRRHPLFCNSYYYCIWDGLNWNFPIFTCPAALIFDEPSQRCAYPEDTAACDGQLAPYPTPQPTTPDSAIPDSATTPEPVTTFAPEVTTAAPQPEVSSAAPETTTEKTWEVDDTSLFACPAPGYYPFEGDCLRFYKCVETDQGKLKGLLYRCPAGYGYSEERKRCWPEDDLPKCMKVLQPAHLRLETATPVYPEDLLWFFNNRK